MRYLTVADVGQLLERRTETVLDWVAEGRLPSLQIQDGLIVPISAIWPYRHVSESDE
jgi:hypothetical protein